MKQTTVLHRTWWSALGVATAATTIVAGWAPVVQAAPAAPQRDNALRQHAADAADGTYESCGAYFGFGKGSDNVLDIVEFDVADKNGSDGVAHAVGTDTQVALELKNEDGDVLECTPVEVTEKMWNDALDDDPVSDISVSADHPLPAWPGPGHYIYPTVNYEPYVSGFGSKPDTDFGTIVSVGYKVTSFPTGHTLVSPTAVKPLAVHYPTGATDQSNVVDPLVLAYLASTAGSAASASFEAALTSCGPDGEGGADFGNDLNAAIDALRTYQDRSLYAGDYSCGNVLNSNAEVSFLLDFSDTVNYREPIVLALPEPPTTLPPSTTTPTVPKPNIATPAKPVSMQPTYTG